MYGAAQSVFSAFLQSFAEAGVGVEDFGEVGEGGTHFDGQGELADKVASAGADQRAAEQEAIFGVCHDERDTVVSTERKGASIGGQRETTRGDSVACACSIFGAVANGGQFWRGVDDQGC